MSSSNNSASPFFKAVHHNYVVMSRGICGTLITESGGTRVFCMKPLGHAGLCDHSQPIKRRLSAQLATLQISEHCTSAALSGKSSPPAKHTIAKPDTPNRDPQPSSVKLLAEELASIRRAVQQGVLKSSARSKKARATATKSTARATAKSVRVCGTPTISENGNPDFCRKPQGHLGDCFPETLSRKRRCCIPS